MNTYKIRKIAKLAAIGAAFTLFGTGIGYAAGEWENIWVQFDSVNLKVNGQNITSSNLLYNDRTYVPLRACAEMLGSTVEWSQTSNTASIVNSNGSTNSYDVKAVGIIMHRLDRILGLSAELEICRAICINFSNAFLGNYSNKETIYSNGIDYLNDVVINDYNDRISYIDDLINNAKKINLDFTKANEIMEYYGDSIDKIKLAYENLVLYNSTSVEKYMKEAVNLANNASDSIAYGDEIRLNLLNKIFEYTQNQ